MKRLRFFCIMVFFALMLCVPVVAQAAGVGAREAGMMPPEEWESYVDGIAGRAIGTDTAGAAVMILKDGEVALDKVYGFADIENNIPVTEDTVFEWGSATKLLVWTSVMQLWERGELDLDADIRAYLPDGFLTKLKYEDPITMMNLMHHDAGWEDVVVGLMTPDPNEILALEETLRHREPAQVCRPGEHTAYSNYGVALAGYIVERISGMPFYEYVNETIFDVLGMKETAMEPTQRDNQSIGKRRDAGQAYGTDENGNLELIPGNRVYIGFYPAGSAMGTPRDAVKFAAALVPMDGKSPLFQNENTLTEMLSVSKQPATDAPGIAHGFWQGLYAVDGLGHSGDNNGFTSSFYFVPEENMTVLVFCNQSGEVVFRNTMMRGIFGIPQADETQILPSSGEVEGTYWMARRPSTGFAKVYGWLQKADVKATGENTIEAMGVEFTQVGPYLYANTSTDEDAVLYAADYLYFQVRDGEPVSLSTISMDAAAVPGWFSPLVNLIFVLLAVCVGFAVVSLIAALVAAVRGRKRGRPLPKIGKLGVVWGIAELLVTANIILLFYRTMNWASCASIQAQVWLNRVFIGFAIAWNIYMIVRMRKEGLIRRQKVFYGLMIVLAIVFVVMLLVLEMWR